MKKNKVGRPKLKNKAKLVALRLPPDLIKKIKKQGPISSVIRKILITHFEEV
jgi:uncharacterized protein (DUF4415 family)